MEGREGMRCAVVALVLALLLPTPFTSWERAGTPAPTPLPFLGTETGAAPVLIVEVYYHTLRADEYVVLVNIGGDALDVAGWSLTDREGTLTFPPGPTIAAGDRIVLAQNASAYYEDTLREATFQYGGGNATALAVSGTFQLNNDGDEVILLNAAGDVVDAFVYGASAYADAGWSGPAAKPVGRGLVARRGFDATWTDTDSAADWDLVRVWSLGQSEVAAASFVFEGSAYAFVSPDRAFEALTGLLDNATASIDASLYTLTNSELAASLRRALARGVQVRLLLEGAPVGGIVQDEWTALHLLPGAGAQIRFLVDNTTLDIQERYRFAHAKYAIVDRRTVIVSTENWGGSAFPTWDATGSRGWTVAVDHAPLAAYFQRVFEEDFDLRRRDVFSFEEMSFSLAPNRVESVAPRAPTFRPRTVTGAFRIIPVLGPDTTLSPETIMDTLRSATESIHVEMFYAHRTWGDFPNLYLEELVAAARRGVQVRLLLDASPYNVEDDNPADNDDTVRYVNEIAATEGLDFQAKLVALDAHGLSRAHTKGLIVDGRTVVVSSVNWNRNSATANREAGLIVENEALGAYFEEVFAWDWKDDLTAPVADAGPDRTVRVGTAVTFSGLGSWDDAAVTNYSWDLDGDGTFDMWGAEVTHRYTATGTFTVRLVVADTWNNTAEDTAIVVVTRPPAPPTVSWPLVLAMLVAAGIASFVLVRRRRKGTNRPP